jgi:hypothetical protein
MIGLIAGGASMRPRRRARTAELIAAAVLAVSVAGCGSDGTITVQEQPMQPGSTASITGTVFAPHGEIASRGNWEWLNPLNLVSKAYAVINPNVMPVGPGALVTFTHIDSVDAADGRIDSPRLIAQGLTNVDGQFIINAREADDVDACRRMVAVGGGEQLTRAFVTSAITNIDVGSEATVRVVLNRLTQAPPAQLCDFTTTDLIRLLDIVSNASYTATGRTVAEINQNAYELAVTNPCVQDAVQKATGSDNDGTPSACLRYYR